MAVGRYDFRGPMAQWLAQATHNRLVAGSNPAGPTYIWGFIFALTAYVGGITRRL
jgi:hypothetical protein